MVMCKIIEKSWFKDHEILLNNAMVFGTFHGLDKTINLNL